MYYLKILVSVFIITLKYSVFCEDDSDDIRVNILRSTLRNYKFNHPPSIPSYQPIPVAIVYDESPRQDKAADLKASTTTKTNFVPKNISKITNFGSKDSDSSTSTANTNKENGAASTTNQPNAITLPVNTETKNVFGEKVEVGKDSILNDSKEYKKDNEQNKGTVTSKIEIKPKNKQIKARIVGGNEIQIPVAIVYEEPRIIRKKIHVRNRVNQERVRGFTLKKIDETPPTTYRPVSSTTNDATTFRVGTKFTIKQESQKPEIQSIKHETSTKTINEESKTATPKTSENTSTPKSGKRRRERVPLVALIVSQQTEIQSTKHETSTKRINEERKTATPKTSENTGTPKIGKRRRDRDPLVPLIVSQQTEIQSTKHETSTKRINEERKTATPKTSENTGTPKIGKHRRERDPLVPLIVSQQTEIPSTKHETSTKRINEERKTATSKNSENTSTPKSVKRRRERDPVVPIIESENRVYSHAGAYKYSYEGGDGTKAFSEGELRTFDEDRTGEAVVGGFSYKDKDGNDYSLTYTADENGYRPVGAHLPTPPPIPPAIARALLYLATKTTPEPVTEPVKFQSLI